MESITGTRKRKGIQLAMPFEERRLLNQGRFHTRWTPPYLVQPKLNGERCRVIREDGICLLLSSTEELILSVPHIQQWCLKHLPIGEWDGELYVHGWTWAEIHGVVSRTVDLHSNYDAMELHVFDWPSKNVAQLMRLVDLNKLFRELPKGGPLRHVKSEVAHTLEEVYQLYDHFIGEGYEGFIIRELGAHYERKRSGAMMKFKPKATDTYTLTGCYEAVSENGEPKGMVGGFNCIDDMGTPFSVGAGKLSHDERIEIWKSWTFGVHHFMHEYGTELEVEYQTLSDKNKVPLFSRAVRII